MSENEMLDRCLAALKKCQSEEEVKEALENCELTDEELDQIVGGIVSINGSPYADDHVSVVGSSNIVL